MLRTGPIYRAAGKNCSSVSSRCRARTTIDMDTDRQPLDQLPGGKGMRVSDAAGLPTDVTLLGPTTSTLSYSTQPTSFILPVPSRRKGGFNIAILGI